MNNFKELGIDNETGEKLISQLEHLEAHGALEAKELTDYQKQLMQEWAKIEMNSCYIPIPSASSYFYDAKLAEEIRKDAMRTRCKIGITKI